MKILGIESSCDDSAACLLDGRIIVEHVIYSQAQEHKEFGGVVPQIAARAHVERLPILIQKCLEKGSPDIIAATAGPGLIAGVMVGLNMAKALSVALSIPFYGINHLEGHILVPRLTAAVPFPYHVLLVSGGHTQLIKVKDVGCYNLLASTLDDSCGECFDKVAKMLGLSPYGKEIEKHAGDGDPNKYDLPVPLKGRTDMAFSFSGLKNAVRTTISEATVDTNDFCASFQRVATQHLLDQTEKLFKKNEDTKNFVLCGGVAANGYIRSSFQKLCEKYSMNFYTPPMQLCTDNAVMIAYACLERIEKGILPSHLGIMPKSRWPLQIDTR
jgi:N6-L-threonylcarbamoyladenine synthase